MRVLEGTRLARVGRTQAGGARYCAVAVNYACGHRSQAWGVYGIALKVCSNDGTSDEPANSTNTQPLAPVSSAIEPAAAVILAAVARLEPISQLAESISGLSATVTTVVGLLGYSNVEVPALRTDLTRLIHRHSRDSLAGVA